MKLKMVDLSRQLAPIKAEIYGAIQGVINSSDFIKGQQVNDFEINLAAWVGVKHVISCANGT